MHAKNMSSCDNCTEDDRNIYTAPVITYRDPIGGSHILT